jgi:integral membrane protein
MSAPSPSDPSPSGRPPPAPPSSTRAVRLFRVCAVAEACSWVGLLVGMFFKYVVVGDDIGVNVFGPIHGALFVAYLVVAVVVGRVLRWDASTFLLALAAAVPPLCTVLFERWARRTGRLTGGYRSSGRAPSPPTPSPGAPSPRAR